MPGPGSVKTPSAFLPPLRRGRVRPIGNPDIPQAAGCEGGARGQVTRRAKPKLYRFWIEKKRPFQPVEEELAAIARQGQHFRRIIKPERDDVIGGLATFMECFDIRTAYPLLLYLLDADLTDQQWGEVSTALESHLVTRTKLRDCEQEMKKHPTTQMGFENPNGQVNRGPHGLAGTDHNPQLYRMECRHCEAVYAANGSDVHARKCPGCQRGQPSSGGWTAGGRG